MMSVKKCRPPPRFLYVLVAVGIISLIAMLNTTGIRSPRTYKSTSSSGNSSPEINTGLVERPPGPVFVLLLTYMRSGSSFTADILQQATEAFYLFEPLRRFYAGKHTSSTSIVNNKDKATVLEARSIIRSWFTCDIHNITAKYLHDSFLARGKKSSKFLKCYQNLTISGMDELAALNECRRLLYQLCTDSPVRIIKTIRMSIYEARALLEEFPNLYIIHLVRDPRGTINSQRKMGKCSASFGEKAGCTNLLCKRVENDVYEEEKILVDYPGRLLPVLYGDIANNPVAKAREMYDFIRQELTQEAERYIRSISETGRDDSKRRQNSSEHIETWKSELLPDFIELIENRCNYILKRYNLQITQN